jgi:hypothetical protein
MSTHDPEFYQAPKFGPEPPEAARKQHGCFFYGCIIASILALLFVILMAVIGFFSYRFVSQLVQDYTASAPRELPKVEMPEGERKALKDRVEAFRKAVNEGTPTDTLILTSDDINALLEEEPDLKGKFYVKIEGDEVKGQVSIPLEKIGLSMVRGRYLNGEADVKASLKDGILIVTLDALEVNGKKVPEEIMKGIRQENLAKDAYKDVKTSEMLRKIESLEIKDGKIILKVRLKPGEATGKPTPKTELPVKVLAPPAADGSPAAPPNGDAAKTKTESPVSDAPVPKS